MIRILKSCSKEIKSFPISVREDLADALARLEEGHVLSMPLSRPMPSIGKGVHELRFRDRAGVFRVVYVLIKENIWMIHAFQKKTEQTASRNIEVVRQRLKELI